MKYYTVKPEYLTLWGETVTEDPVIDTAEVERLAVEWEKPLDELLNQLTEVDRRVAICSILLNDSDEERQIISYDREDHRLYSDAQDDAINEGQEYATIDEAAEACQMMWFNTIGWDPEWIENT